MSDTKWRYGLCGNVINSREYYIIWRRTVRRLYSEEINKDIELNKVTKRKYDELIFHMKNIYGKEITFEKVDRAFYTECILYVAERSFYTHNEKLTNIVNRILARIDYKSDTKMSYEELSQAENVAIFRPGTDAKHTTRFTTWNTCD